MPEVTVTPDTSGSPGNEADGPRPARASGRRIRGLEPEERRQERRRQLLASALDLFAAQGYAHTSIEQICQNAYVGFKGFYDEFATKEALFLALYDDLLHRVGTAIAEALDVLPPESDPIRELLGVFVRGVLDDPRVAQILFIEAAGLSPTVEVHRRTMYREFASFLEQTYAAGEFSPGLTPPEGLSVRRISLGVVGAIVEVMVDWLVEPEPDELDRLIDDLEAYCRVVVAGLVASW